ncbi:MAG TPA: HNH endonuclease, partial [Cyanobacteria bacterium UBA11166]|nr:HNH endonuclease [Cyanobacteria bacterium UBA11166]
MSTTYISAALRRLVEERANRICEYCLLPADVAFFPHEVDHVIPEKHNGETNANNLAFTCWRCNRHKGTDLGSFDPETGRFSFLFNPRTQQWIEHFIFDDLTIV